MRAEGLKRKALEAALLLAETRAWSQVTLAEITAEAGLSLADLHGVTDKDRLSAAVEPMLDQAMSEGSLDPSETPRTRLFDVLMMRFEAMEDRRDGVMSFLRWRDGSLSGLALRVKAREATARWAIACAGLDGESSLIKGGMQLGLIWAIAQAERAWRSETSPDLTRTMACLDAELLKLEARLKRVAGLRSSRSTEAETST